jgi:hypothetical protein
MNLLITYVSEEKEFVFRREFQLFLCAGVGGDLDSDFVDDPADLQ